MSSGSTYDDAAAGNYQDLPQGNFIRCLVLSPGSGSDPLACELQTVDLDKQPDFEAISYVWGSDVKSETISCNGRTTYITANLSAALKRVRYASEPRSLWADSICIDQKNDKEKSHQVALMGKIYSCSRRTLIHIIGNDNGHAASVQSLVSLLDKSINHELNKIDPENGETVDFPPATMKNYLRNACEIDYVSLLLAQPWFHRGWVIQEAVLAKDAVLLWGLKTEISYHTLIRCANWLGLRCFDIFTHAPILHTTLHLTKFGKEALGFGRGEESPFLQTLHLARSAELRDPIDRVYAFLSLAAMTTVTSKVSASDLILQPDYTKSAEAAYTELTRRYLEEGDLRALQYVQHTEETLADKKTPTWVIRWDVLQNTSLDPYRFPSLLGRPHTRTDVGTHAGPAIHQDVLGIRGILFDRITQTLEPMTDSVNLKDTGSYWRSLSESDYASAYPPEKLPLALLATLVRGIIMEDMWRSVKEREKKLFKWWKESEELSSRLSKDTQDVDQMLGGILLNLVSTIQRAISTYASGRRIICTEKGYLGNAPLLAQEGDLCCILFGATTPFILREVHEEKNSGQRRFLLVGDAWIAGKQWPLDGFGRSPMFGAEESKEWVDWDIEEQTIYIT